MNMTPGELFFYGGIAGMVLVAVITIVLVALFAGSRKRLRHKLFEEYGNIESK